MFLREYNLTLLTYRYTHYLLFAPVGRTGNAETEANYAPELAITNGEN